MTYSRYKETRKNKNISEMFSEHFKKRDVTNITHYLTPKFTHTDPDKNYQITEYKHIWSRDDKLYKLAYEHYGNSELWWIIAWYNKKPTESHFQIGDEVLIPKPIEIVLSIMGV
jgi:hypothetical protein